MDKLNYNEAVNFIRNNFDSSLELVSLMNKYKSGMRYPSLGDIDKIIHLNRDLLFSITGEVANKSLDIFNEGKDQLDLEFWLETNYPTEQDLKSLIDTYTEGYQLQDVKDHLVVVNNFDDICQYYFDKYHPEDKTLVESDNKELKTFSIEPSEDEVIFNDSVVKLQHLVSIFIQDLKYAHWTTYGSTFVGMHELYEEMYKELEELQDKLVETILSIDRNLVCHPAASISVENDLKLNVGRDLVSCVLEKLSSLEVELGNIHNPLMQPTIDSFIEFINKYTYKFNAITLEEYTTEAIEAKISAFCNKSQRKLLNSLIKTL